MIKKIKLKGYNKKFPIYFQKEKRILSRLGKLEIQHIGSTAVPDIIGKGEIDILIIIKSLKQRKSLIERLEKIGYKKAKTQRDYRIFLSRKRGKTKYNLHVYIGKNEKAREQIKFRDFLRRHPNEARRYENLKKSILKKAKGDRVKYKKLKEDYFKGIAKKIE